ncbi:MAG: low molecular weight phosphatase family protein [Candidatus Saccharimonadales bacterium]
MNQNNQKLYECPECHLKYRQKEWAQKCKAWCKKHRSCNLEITAHAVRVVLFACTENKKRSQMAEAIFNHISKKAVATSAGTMPASAVEPRLDVILQEIGIAVPESLTPKKITDEMLASANYIISFGCLVPAMFPPEKFEEWQIADPQTDDELRATRDELVKKIKTLIQKKNL